MNRALTGLSRRTTPGSGMEHGMDELIRNYDLYKQDFFDFFPTIIAATSNFLETGKNY